MQGGEAAELGGTGTGKAGPVCLQRLAPDGARHTTNAQRFTANAQHFLTLLSSPSPPYLGCEGSTGVPRPGEDQSPLSRGALAAAAAGGGAAAAAASSAADAGSRASVARREGAGVADAASSGH